MDEINTDCCEDSIKKPDKSVNADIAPSSLAKYIDHTLLKPEATQNQIKELCREAISNRFASVCVNTCHVPLAAELLLGSGVTVCAVIGFPLGACAAEVKAFEAKYAVAHGAQEIDMVINVGMLKSGQTDYVLKDISEVVNEVKDLALVKVIIEACLLTDEEKIMACRLAKQAGAAFVKTSTGFGKFGATVEDVVLMRRTVGMDMGVKASGGVRTYEDAVAMIKAGADRLGASSGVQIVGRTLECSKKSTVD